MLPFIDLTYNDVFSISSLEQSLQVPGNDIQ